ncbi:hypothetical protein DL770_010806 [Monosporascus sp. CRB-9-2]|nr:hypothetical protein DL770_010806 [Monosporascus sp. CRB-9-2]
MMHQRVPIGTDMQLNTGAPKPSAERLRCAKELMANYFPQPAPHVEDPVGKAGFHPRSGGGYVGLNNEYGVMPLAFLNAGLVRTDIYDTPDLKGNIEGHLDNSWNIKTYFSSWAASFEVALKFADTSDGYVAIIDTSLLDDIVRVYHTPDLRAAGPSRSSYKEEYLA